MSDLGSTSPHNGSKDSKSLKEEGNKAYALHNYTEALRLYDAALEVCASHEELAVLHSNRSSALLALGRHDEALASADAAAAANPSWAKAHFRRASALSELGRLKEAEDACKEALRLDAAQHPDAESPLAKSVHALLTEIRAKAPSKNTAPHEADAASAFLQKILAELPDFEELMKVAREQGVIPSPDAASADGSSQTPANTNATTTTTATDDVPKVHISDHDEVPIPSENTTSSTPASPPPAEERPEAADTPVSDTSSDESAPEPEKEAQPKPRVRLDDNAETRDSLLKAWEEHIAEKLSSCTPAAANPKTAFESFRYPLRTEFVNSILGCARLALRNRALASSISKKPLFGGVRLEIKEHSTRVVPAVVEELGRAFGVPVITVSAGTLKSISSCVAPSSAETPENDKTTTSTTSALPQDLIVEALLRVVADRPAILYFPDEASALDDDNSAYDQLFREALTSKTRPNLFVFGVGDATQSRPFMTLPRQNATSSFDTAAGKAAAATAGALVPLDPSVLSASGLPKGTAAFTIPITLPADADVGKAVELFASLNDKFADKFDEVVQDDPELQRIQRENPAALLPAMLAHPRAKKILDELIKETVQTVSKASNSKSLTDGSNSSNNSNKSAAAAGAPRLDPLAAVLAAEPFLPGVQANLPWPPVSLDLSAAPPAMPLFLMQAKVPLRRIAQLSDAEIASATVPRFTFGSIEDERKYALANDITHMESMGITIRDAVIKLWGGERSEQALTKGLSENVAFVVRTLLYDLEAHKQLACNGGLRASKVFDLSGRKAASSSLTPVRATRKALPAPSGERKRTAAESKSAADKGAIKVYRRPVDHFSNQGPSGMQSILDQVGSFVIEAPSEPVLLARWRKAVQFDQEEENLRKNLSTLEAVLKRKNLALESGAAAAATAQCEASHAPAWHALVRTKILGESLWEDVLCDAVHYLVVHEGDDLPVDGDGRPVVLDKGILYGLRERAGLSPETTQRRKRRTEEELKALCSNKYEEEIAGSLIEAEDIGVSWDDIGGLVETKELLREISVYPMRYPELYTTKGPKGVLLFGPPGTGKTMLAKAVATESGANFISVDSTTIGSKWYGESEKYAKAVFTLARKLAPCVIFIDEIDSLLSSRDDTEKTTIASVKTTLMREWDGLGTTNDRVMVMGATNRPFALDEAILRRLPRRVMVDLPEESERLAILKVGLEGRPVAEDVDLDEFARRLKQYSGSDIHELCRDAILRSSHEKARELDAQGIHHVPALTSVRPISKKDLELALEKIRPSVAEDSAVMAKVREWDENYGETGRKRGTQKPLLNMYS